MSRLLIQNGRVIDPSQKMDRVTNLLIEDGRIAAFDVESAGGAAALDASGKIVAPGLIDIHVHLRDPGKEEDETIETGTAAALAGGFTSIACCPNTDPPIDSQGTVEYIKQKAARADNCNVYAIACVSKNREGKELAEIGQLVEAGAVGISDDGAPVYSPELLRRAFEYCLMFGIPVMNHPEILELTQNGVMHEGVTQLVLGLGGIPAAAEDVMVSRDVALAEATRGRLHVMHVSSGGSIHIIRRAKKRGVRVTTEVTPHHFTLTDECLRTFDSNYKMNPPCAARGVQACIEGLQDGTIDCIVTDHALRQGKENAGTRPGPLRRRRAGTALGLVVTELIEPGHLTWSQALEKMTINPARVIGVPKGTLAVDARCRRGDHRSRKRLEGGPRQVPRKHQYSVCWLGNSPDGPRR